MQLHPTWTLATRKIGRKVCVLDQTDSTNSRAMELAGAPDSDGIAILADHQTAGRGQHARRWLAAPRSSVLLSVLIYPRADLARPALLTAWAAVTVAEVVRQLTGTPPRIKWPNDVLVRGRKVCGILIEQTRQGAVPATVVGLGLNVTQTLAEFEQAGLPEATSLAALGARDLDSHSVARLVLESLDDDLAQLEDEGPALLESRWKWHLGLLGRQVVAECVDGERRGRLLECAFRGLSLQQSQGETLLLAPEMIQHIREA
ncbi:MAG: biotin--[acetyl-CoA-carboxylase] ligase [Gemmataceae bacterium]